MTVGAKRSPTNDLFIMEKRQKEMIIAVMEKSGTCEIRVGGWSMWPFIRNNDIIRVARGVAPPYLGKVVAIFNGEQLIAHRVVWARRENGGRLIFWVLGDFFPGSLSRVEEDHLMGTVLGVRREGAIKKFWFIQPFCGLAIVIGFFLRTILSVGDKIKSVSRN